MHGHNTVYAHNIRGYRFDQQTINLFCIITILMSCLTSLSNVLVALKCVSWEIVPDHITGKERSQTLGPFSKKYITEGMSLQSLKCFGASVTFSHRKLIQIPPVMQLGKKSDPK